MATLRDIKRKIGAVKKTSQITRAMNMVAAAKLRVVQAQMEVFHPYADKFKEVVSRLTAGVEAEDVPELMKPREEVRKVEVIALTADRGLCGAFNNNLIATAERFIRGRQDDGLEVSITGAGKKGSDYFRRRAFQLRERYTGLLNKPNYDDAQSLGRELIGLYENQECDEIYVVYSHFISTAKQEARVVRLLPIAPEAMEESPEQAALEYLFEPSHQELLADLLPSYVFVQLLESFFQTAVSEHAARMAAMDNATSNCKELVRDLTLTYNKARQAAITAELMDIVGGAEALS